MEEILEDIKNKPIRSPKETTILELYKQLGSYSSEEITTDTKVYLISTVYNFDKLVFMNMKILSAALVMLQLMQINGATMNEKNFHRFFELYIKKYFIPSETLNVDHLNLYYQDIKLDIY